MADTATSLSKLSTMGLRLGTPSCLSFQSLSPAALLPVLKSCQWNTQLFSRLNLFILQLLEHHVQRAVSINYGSPPWCRSLVRTGA